MKQTERNLFEYLTSFAEEEGAKVFFSTEEQSFTAREILEKVSGIADYLQRNGVKSGELAALGATRSLETALLFYALQTLGVVTLLCDPHSSPSEFIKESGVDVSPRHVIDFSNGAWRLNGKPFPVASLRACPPRLGYKTDVKAPAVIIFTSGSTGKSKGVTLSQYNYLNHVLNYSPAANYRADDVSPELLPLHHVFGLAVILTALVNRYRVFFPERVTPEYVGECIEKYKFTRLDGVPSFAQALSNAKIAKGYNTESLRVGVLGGAPSSKEQFCFIQETLGLKLLPVYGQSECIGITGAGEEYSDDCRANSVGKFLSMNEGFILDKDGKALPLGQEGEICVKSPAVMLGYWKDQARTKEAIDAQGRLHTGDLGYLDERGFLHVTGRIKDIIIRNGHNLSASKIEGKLLSVPCVAEAAVVGVADAVCGEVPVAIITLKRGHGYDESAVKAVFSKLEMPKEIRVVKAIPLTSTGKTDKAKIKEAFRE